MLTHPRLRQKPLVDGEQTVQRDALRARQRLHRPGHGPEAAEDLFGCDVEPVVALFLNLPRPLRVMVRRQGHWPRVTRVV
jgi:hypothetical protein